jgi:hypothetical protein
MYSTTEPAKAPSRPFLLGMTNSCYTSSFLLLLDKEPMYVVLASNSEDTSISFSHLCALCPIPPQFPERGNETNGRTLESTERPTFP